MGTLYEININQRIQVEAGSIKIRDLVNTESPNPLGVAPVTLDFQIRIGQKYSSIIQLLREARIPIIFQTVCILDKTHIYNIVRVGAGNIPEVVLGSLTVYNDIVISYQYNSLLRENRIYASICPLPAMQQIKIKKSPTSKTKAHLLISRLTGTKKDRLSAEERSNLICITYKEDIMLNKPLYYLFSLGKDNNFRFNSIGYRM